MTFLLPLKLKFKKISNLKLFENEKIALERFKCLQSQIWPFKCSLNCKSTICLIETAEHELFKNAWTEYWRKPPLHAPTISITSHLKIFFSRFLIIFLVSRIGWKRFFSYVRSCLQWRSNSLRNSLFKKDFCAFNELVQ